MIFPHTFLLLALLAAVPITLQSPLQGRSQNTEKTRSLSISTSSTTLDRRYTSVGSRLTITTIPLSTEPRPTITTIPLHTITRPASTIASKTLTSSAAVPTKTGVTNCHVQGLASELLASNIWGSTRASDPMTCQRQCMYISQCESYSFQTPSAKTPVESNCVFYHMFIDGHLAPSKTSGVFFSDKYPSDGSNFCYGSIEL